MATQEQTNAYISANKSKIANYKSVSKPRGASGGTDYSSVVAPKGSTINEQGVLSYTTDKAKVTITPQGQTTTQTYNVNGLPVSPAFAQKLGSAETQKYISQEQQQIQKEQQTQQQTKFGQGQFAGNGAGGSWGETYGYRNDSKNYNQSTTSISNNSTYQTPVSKALGIKAPPVSTDYAPWQQTGGTILRGSLLGVKELFVDFPVEFTTGFYKIAKSTTGDILNPSRVGTYSQQTNSAFNLVSNKDVQTIIGTTTLAPVVLSAPSLLVSGLYGAYNYFEYSKDPSLESGTKAVTKTILGTNIVSDITKLPSQISLFLTSKFQPASQLTPIQVVEGASKFVTSKDLGVRNVPQLIEQFRGSQYAKNLIDFGKKDISAPLPKIFEQKAFGSENYKGVDLINIKVGKSNYGQYSGAFSVSPVPISSTIEAGQGKYISVPLKEQFTDKFGVTTLKGGQPVGNELPGVFGAPATSFYFGKAGSQSQTQTFSLLPKFEFGIPTSQFIKVAPENILPMQLNPQQRLPGKFYISEASTRNLQGKGGKTEGEGQFAVGTQIQYIRTPSYTFFNGAMFQNKIYQAVAPPKTIGGSIKQSFDTFFRKQDIKATESYSAGTYGSKPIGSLSSASISVSSYKPSISTTSSSISTSSSSLSSAPSYQVSSSYYTSEPSSITSSGRSSSTTSSSISSEPSISESIISISKSITSFSRGYNAPSRPVAYPNLLQPKLYKEPKKTKKQKYRRLIKTPAVYKIQPDLLSTTISYATFGSATAPKLTNKQQNQLAYELVKEGRMIFPTQELMSKKPSKRGVFLNPSNLIK